eukprot:1062206-Prymnesium_polylepis.2
MAKPDALTHLILDGRQHNAVDKKQQAVVCWEYAHPIEINIRLVQSDTNELLPGVFCIQLALVFADNKEPVPPPNLSTRFPSCVMLVNGECKCNYRIVARSHSHKGRRFLVQYKPTDPHLTAMYPGLSCYSANEVVSRSRLRGVS